MATVTFNDNPVSSTVSSDRYDFIVISGEKIHPEREPVNLTTTVSYMQAFKDGETTTFAAYYPVIFSASDPLTVRGPFDGVEAGIPYISMRISGGDFQTAEFRQMLD